ncbi:MAG: hypothetical protein JXA78_09460 [Anaerolineales bacterium]|nr:hypothetical protein [Anaerolineales bacterium]
MSDLNLLRRIAEVEFTAIVVQSGILENKLRVFLTDNSYVDVWVSRKLSDRFGFHWERRHLDGRLYRYDNFSDTNWSGVSTFPYHFHDGDQDNVVAAPFSRDIEQGFREFMTFVQRMLGALNAIVDSE